MTCHPNHCSKTPYALRKHLYYPRASSNLDEAVLLYWLPLQIALDGFLKGVDLSAPKVDQIVC